MDDTMVEQVLRAVELVPSGRVVSYGDVAELVGTGPRQVGGVLAGLGSSVPWWRVTNRDGDLPEALLMEARAHWIHEGIPVKDDGSGCRISHCRADLGQWVSDFERLSGSTPG